MTEEIWDIYKELKASLEDNLEDNEILDEITEIQSMESTLPIERININVCSNCGKDALITEVESRVCTACGVDNGRVIDYAQEWRYYGSDDNKRASDPTRCGLPINPLLPESSLSTIVLGKGYETYRRLNCWNGMTYRERSLINVLNHISKKAKSGNIPTCIVDKTIAMYKMLSEEHIRRGESRESLIAACVMNALKDKNIPRSSTEIAELFGIRNKKLSKGCNQFAEIMYSKDSDYLKKIKPTEPKDLINRYCDILEIDEVHRKYSMTVANLSDKLGICPENNPKSIAVGSIYLVSQVYRLEFSKKDIAKKCKTSEVTISKTYSEMVKFQKYLLPY